MENKGMSLREGKRESISERGMVKLSTREWKVTVQKAFHTGRRADSNTLVWEWTWSVPVAENRQGNWRTVRKQEKLGKRLKREAGSGHTEPDRSPGLTSTVHWMVYWGNTPMQTQVYLITGFHDSYFPVFLISPFSILRFSNLKDYQWFPCSKEKASYWFAYQSDKIKRFTTHDWEEEEDGTAPGVLEGDGHHISEFTDYQLQITWTNYSVSIHYTNQALNL